MTALAPERERAQEGLDMGYVQTMLVKFFLASRDEVLPGITQNARPSQNDLDDKHAQELKLEQISMKKAMRGRVRPDNVDTGVEVYHQVDDVALPTIAEALLRAEYGFRDVHFFEQSKGRKLYVVVFAFEYGVPSAENVEELQRQFAAYAANSWTLSLWDNPNLTSTANLTRRVRGRRAGKKLVVSKRNFMHVV